MATKQEITSAIRAFVERAETIAGRLSPADWQKTVYEQGWTVKQAYCHLAAMGGAVPFFISMAASPQPPAGAGGGGGGFDVDAWNAQQVAARQDKPIDEILSELKAGHENGIKTVEVTSEELLVKEIALPFEDLSGSLGDLLTQTATGHNQVHLEDIDRAVQGG
ncbi:MAG: maleylpyruvate isomerase N-terminal domain-containing protein [Chloroflexota bacterium]|nr:maleylpyruvate isomerase N-terminal domain-containing protein [Chloroflexota bacterium]